MNKSFWIAAVTALMLFFPNTGEAKKKSEKESELYRDFVKVFEMAVLAYEQQRYEDAIEFFTLGYEIQPNPDLLYNIGRSYHSLNNCAKALEYYVRFKEVTQNMEARRRADSFIQILGRCHGYGYVEIGCSPEDIMVYPDYSDSGYSCGKIQLKAGNRKLRFEANGYASQERYVNVTDKEAVRLSISLDGKEPVFPGETTEKTEKKSEIDAYGIDDKADSKLPNYVAIAVASVGTLSLMTALPLHIVAHNKAGESKGQAKGLFYAAVALDVIGLASMVTSSLFFAFDYNPVASISISDESFFTSFGIVF